MHAKTNHTSARISDDINSPTRVSDDLSGPIRLRHVSPIRLCHVSLTHPQTLINRSLPKAFQQTKTSWRGPSHLEHMQHQRRFRSTKALLESSPETSRNFKNFNLKCKEHSKQNHPCREKIPDLSQTDILYYKVHKIQPIIKCYVLLLGFAVTTQPT